jgi:hypothetical protein
MKRFNKACKKGENIYGRRRRLLGFMTKIINEKRSAVKQKWQTKD